MTDVAQLVPMHPEAVDGDPSALRWVVPPGLVPFVGPVHAAPGELGRLLTEGVIRTMACESCAVVVRLGDGRRWADELDRVREALPLAIRDGGWTPYDDAQRGSEALLTAAVREVLAGPAGDYVRSHGGEVQIASVADDAVEVRFAGTCGHCPATGITLHDRLETEVRHKYPALRSISATDDGHSNRPRFFTIRRRRDC